MMIFSTDKMMETMSLDHDSFFDDTFVVCPTLLYQLYIGRVIIDGHNVTTMLAFLPGKTQEIYKEIFSKLVERADTLNLELNPLYIHLDFELAAHKASTSIFPSASLRG